LKATALLYYDHIFNNIQNRENYGSYGNACEIILRKQHLLVFKKKSLYKKQAEKIDLFKKLIQNKTYFPFKVKTRIQKYLRN